MGSYKEDEDVISCNNKFQKIVKTCISFLASFLMSMVGGLILVWWDLYYHPSNSQLWMVPIGLILLVTPVIVWFSGFFSDICSSISPLPSPTTKESYGDGGGGSSLLDQPVKLSMDNSVRDPERR